ncbi:hypothetical protein, partial [Bradyrhizobium sp.]|uniref:hypothetical protein n=1 Tax=Bradyrhizobium sp. TaxID=376 RepID=UPI0040380E67
RGQWQQHHEPDRGDEFPLPHSTVPSRVQNSVSEKRSQIRAVPAAAEGGLWPTPPVIARLDRAIQYSRDGSD